MLISGSPNLSDELKDMNEGMRDHDCCEKSIIYIHNSGLYIKSKPQGYNEQGVILSIGLIDRNRRHLSTLLAVQSQSVIV